MSPAEPLRVAPTDSPPPSAPVNGHAARAADVLTAAVRPAVEALLWTLAEAAAALSLSTRTLKRMAAAGELPGTVRIGRRRLFSRRALEDWIEQGCPPLRRQRKRSR